MRGKVIVLRLIANITLETTLAVTLTAALGQSTYNITKCILNNKAQTTKCGYDVVWRRSIKFCEKCKV